jgi:hypothetical protein
VLISKIGELNTIELKSFNKHNLICIVERLVYIYYFIDFLDKSYDKNVASVSPQKNKIFELMFVYIKVNLKFYYRFILYFILGFIIVLVR